MFFHYDKKNVFYHWLEETRSFIMTLELNVRLRFERHKYDCCRSIHINGDGLIGEWMVEKIGVVIFSTVPEYFFTFMILTPLLDGYGTSGQCSPKN